jgi:toxin YoeB
MIVAFSDSAAFYSFYEWTFTNSKIAKKIAKLIKDIQRDPVGKGLGKAEVLKGDLAGHFSRRITGEHRLIYKITGDTIFITTCKGHYD